MEDLRKFLKTICKISAQFWQNSIIFVKILLEFVEEFAEILGNFENKFDGILKKFEDVSRIILENYFTLPELNFRICFANYKL